jgi:peptidoglycan/LPS O-acetylase OafA/YrhL
MISRPEPRERGAIGRLPALDGLRGIAAVIVVLYHSSLVARPFIETGTVGDAWWWITQTPLKILFAGTESVLVFFVLSGLVVALPTLTRGFSWVQFLSARFLRLYLPVWGALVLATALVLLIPRSLSAVTDGAWIDNGSARSVDWAQFLSEASLWRVSYDIDNVLWSLRWELIFSILLPVFVGLALLVKRWWPAATLIACALTATGRIVAVDALVYLPVFFLGTLMAVWLPELLESLKRVPARGWVAIAVVSGALMIASWPLRPLLPSGSLGNSIVWGLAGVGAAGMILIALGSERARRALSSRPVRWLGTVSFSLYLVHVPVIQTFTYLFGDDRWYLALAVAIPASFIVAQAFFAVVERPSHRMARAVGARLSAATTARVSTSEPSLRDR